MLGVFGKTTATAQFKMGVLGVGALNGNVYPLRDESIPPEQVNDCAVVKRRDNGAVASRVIGKNMFAVPKRIAVVGLIEADRIEKGGRKCVVHVTERESAAKHRRFA